VSGVIKGDEGEVTRVFFCLERADRRRTQNGSNPVTVSILDSYQRAGSLIEDCAGTLNWAQHLPD